MRKIRVAVNNLKYGMRVFDDIYALNGLLLALKGSIVDERLIALLKRSGITAINIYNDASNTGKPNDIIVKEFKEAFNKVQNDIKTTFDQILDDSNNEIDVEKIMNQSEYLILKTGNNYDLLNMLLDIGEESDCTYQHALQVSMISRIIGNWLELPEKDIALLGIAGLFHDIGKCRVDPEILNKKEALNRYEIEKVRQHAIEGYKIIKDKNIDHQVKQVVLSHHERLDGSGYPLKIKASEIGPFTRIVAIADVYAAMIEKRTYRKHTYTPFEAVHYLEYECTGKFDPKYLITFLSHILNSYLHRKVKLSNGLTGEIIFINKSNLSKPLLKVSGGYLDLSLNPKIFIEKIL